MGFFVNERIKQIPAHSNEYKATNNSFTHTTYWKIINSLCYKNHDSVPIRATVWAVAEIISELFIIATHTSFISYIVKIVCAVSFFYIIICVSTRYFINAHVEV